MDRVNESKNLKKKRRVISIYSFDSSNTFCKRNFLIQVIIHITLGGTRGFRKPVLYPQCQTVKPALTNWELSQVLWQFKVLLTGTKSVSIDDYWQGQSRQSEFFTGTVLVNKEIFKWKVSVDNLKNMEMLKLKCIPCRVKGYVHVSPWWN